jgi:hypothetical protein
VSSVPTIPARRRPTAFAPANQTALAFRPADGKLAIKVLTQYERLASTGWT